MRIASCWYSVPLHITVPTLRQVLPNSKIIEDLVFIKKSARLKVNILLSQTRRKGSLLVPIGIDYNFGGNDAERSLSISKVIQEEGTDGENLSKIFKPRNFAKCRHSVSYDLQYHI